jgi:hypothetical protein
VAGDKRNEGNKRSLSSATLLSREGQMSHTTTTNEPQTNETHTEHTRRHMFERVPAPGPWLEVHPRVSSRMLSRVTPARISPLVSGAVTSCNSMCV